MIDMKRFFSDILEMDGVYGLALLGENGQILFESLGDGQFRPRRSQLWWKTIIESLGGFCEMNFIFEHGRCYLRRTDSGCLIIGMGPMASMAMVKLNCDIIMPQLPKMVRPLKAVSPSKNVDVFLP